MGVSSPIAIVAGARQRKPGDREIGKKRTIKQETWSLCHYSRLIILLAIIIHTNAALHILK